MKTLSLSLFLFLFLSIKGIQWASINYLGWVIKTYPIQIKFNMNYRFILIINKTLKGLDIYLTHTHVTLLIRIIWILFCVFFYNFIIHQLNFIFSYLFFQFYHSILDCFQNCNFFNFFFELYIGLMDLIFFPLISILKIKSIGNGASWFFLLAFYEFISISWPILRV
jgi:hypothetical protein